MNNSFLSLPDTQLTLESSVDNRPILKEKEGELVQIIEALRDIQSSEAWSTLKEKVFDSLTDSLNQQLHSEARKEIPDTLKLSRLAGQLKWSERYSDLSKLEGEFRTQLSNVRTTLYGKTQERPE